LTVANPNLATQGAGPYATVDITGSGTSWHVSATRLDNFVFGDGNIFDINIASGTATLLTASCSFSPCSQDTTPGAVDGFGTFTLKVDDGAGFSSPLTSLSFDFTTSVSFADVSALLLPNNTGAFIAAHMALATNTACTGFAANTGATAPTGTPDNSSCVSQVSEPAAVFLLGLGVIAIAVGSRKFAGATKLVAARKFAHVEA
jgi:hypothetical protein